LPFLAIPALALCGALAGFVVYNLPPARIYLGDCGSLPLGLILALLGQEVSRTATGSVNLPVALLLLFVPLLDTGLAVVRRTLRGKSFMTPDYSHVHHQMLSQGLRVWSVLVVMGGLATISSAMACCGIASGNVAWPWAAVIGFTGLLAWRRLVAAEEQQLVRHRVVEAVAARRREAGVEHAGQVRSLRISVGGEQAMQPRTVPLAKAATEQRALTGRQAA
jgi:UDP-GlcNAc:undecaprenyl-phosphate GlcNAc-1-phosphate transferase